MKQTITCLIIAFCFFSCSEKIKTIEFSNLKEDEFNSKQYELPPGSVPDSIKRAHDSCMGFIFDANAMLIRAKEFLFIGSILNKQSLQVVNTLKSFGLTQTQLTSQFNVITSPCYEKKVLPFPLKSLLGSNFQLQLPGANEALNKEIYNAIATSSDAEMQTGSWLYLDIKDALKNMLDTAKSEEALKYKSNLLDTSNMILTAVESVMDVSFMVNAVNDMSPSLQALLQNKPSVTIPEKQMTMKLTYISNKKFLLSFNSVFPIMGQFMKADVK